MQQMLRLAILLVVPFLPLAACCQTAAKSVPQSRSSPGRLSPAIDVAQNQGDHALLGVKLAVNPTARISQKFLLDDYVLFRKALEEGHAGLYRYTSREEMNASFEAAKRMIDREMDALEFYRVLAPVIGKIKCGHTELILPTDQRAVLDRIPLFPGKVVVIGERLYMLRDYSPAAILTGKEILSINGIGASGILAKMSAVIHGDANTTTSSARRLSDETVFAEQLHVLLGIESPFNVQYQDGVQVKNRTLEGLEKSRIADVVKTRYPQDQTVTDNAELHFVDAGKIAVLTVRTFRDFVDKKKTIGMRQFFQSSFQEIGRLKTQTLILDLRDNGGGNDEIGKLLATFLISKPFSYYRDLVINSLDSNIFSPDRRIATDTFEKRSDGKYHRTNHPNLGIQRPSSPAFAGKVITLINGGSFSTTCELLSVLRFHQRATFIGEETGGDYYGNTSGYGAAIILPHSELKVDIPRLAYYMAVSGYPADRGILPDIPASYSIQELLAKKDKEMELALALARTGLS